MIHVYLTNQNSHKKHVRNAHVPLPWPSLESHHSEKRQHGVTNIVKVKIVSLPFSLLFLLPPQNIPRVSVYASKMIKVVILYKTIAYALLQYGM